MRAKTWQLSAVMLATLVGLVAGCAAPPTGRPGALVSTRSTPPADRQTAVYLSVLHYFLTSGDTSFGAHRFARLFMRDLASKSGFDGTPGPTEAISTEVQQALIAGMADLGTLEFIQNDSEAIDLIDGCAQVRDGGILITLAPVAPTGNVVQIAVEGFVACLGAVWLTYVVELHDGAWKVTGTTGPMAIA